jgi:hypothetical protein
MTWAIRILAMAVFATIAFSDVEACTCAYGDGPACQEAWRQSVDAVLLGRVEKIESSKGMLGLAPGTMSMTRMGGLMRVTFAVEEGYRGVSEKTIQVYTNESSAACGFPFQQGERYLVFASKTKDAQLAVSLCSATRPAKYAEEDIAYLRSVPSLPSTATIMGSVWRYTHDPNFKPKFQPSLMDHYRPPEQDYVAMAPAPGIAVVAKAQDGTEHVATVNSDGNWRISDLAPGPYTVHPQSNESTFVHPFMANVEVAPRGCAKVDIRVESNGRISGTLDHRPPASDWALLKVFVLPFPNPDWRHPAMEKTLELNESTFEIGPLPPGRYVLGAYLVKKIGTPDRYSLADFGRNYFPGVWDPNLAQPIDVAEGKAVTNVRFKAMF